MIHDVKDGSLIELPWHRWRRHTVCTLVALAKERDEDHKKYGSAPDGEWYLKKWRAHGEPGAWLMAEPSILDGTVKPRGVEVAKEDLLRIDGRLWKVVANKYSDQVNLELELEDDGEDPLDFGQPLMRGSRKVTKRG